MVRNCRWIELVSGDPDGACERRVDRFPDAIVQFDLEARGAEVARRRHIDGFACLDLDVPNTRRIGWAKLPAVYCVAGLRSG